KIVATLGPASAGEDVIARLFDAGVDVVRLNLSHGSHDDHRRMIRTVRRVARAQQRFVPVIVDLMGPRYRLGQLSGVRTLAAGEEVSLGEGADLPVEDPEFLRHLRPGERMLVDNGLVELEVLEIDERRVRTRVRHGGPVSTRKGINLPDTDLPFTISDKDRADVALAVAEGADYVAVSFVGGPEDLRAVREVVRGAGGLLPLVAKLERAKAMENLLETVREADAVMVARGDLGVEVPLHQVPVWQKKIIGAGRRYGKPVIVATQMLESMTQHPRPTRAESSDVANAVFDGADALMLSGETAAGAYPVEAVRTMAEIIVHAESYEASRPAPEGRGAARQPLAPGPPEIRQLSERDVHLEIPEVVSATAVRAAGWLAARRIVAFSQGGFTARMIARYRPRPPITVFTPDPGVARRLQLVWGARPLLMEQVHHHDEVVRVVDRLLLDSGLAAPGDTLVILMGDPIDQRPLTNLMRIHRVRTHSD
ncbi:MAG TPA: pyruvate kinase, partial [Thermoanaerobaculia bacterium]